MDNWMDEWRMDKWMDEWIDGQMDELINGWMMDRQMDGWLFKDRGIEMQTDIISHLLCPFCYIRPGIYITDSLMYYLRR